MKKSVKEKFKQDVNFVRPLYRRAKFRNRVRPMRKLLITVDVSQNTKLCGYGIHVKRKVVEDKSVDYNVINIISENCAYKNSLPGACERVYEKTYPSFKCVGHVTNVGRKFRKNASFKDKELSGVGYGKMEEQEDFDVDRNKSVQAINSEQSQDDTVSISWLRVYPAPQRHDETICTVVFRCMFCQLGLATFIILWTLLWTFIVHHYEGPYEQEVSEEFEKTQNQLLIDLATELRQITPLSPKWRKAIEQRLYEERRITVEAVGRGAKIAEGQFWNLSGTFLFNIYVMTALGFGAPVPHTVWGRTSALIYATIAVPLHIFLMVHASTCTVIFMNKYTKRFKAKHCKKRNRTDDTESPNHSRNSEVIKPMSERNCCRCKWSFLNILFVGRCVPLAMVLYYAAGVVSFGVLRGRTSLEAALFPLEFTTTGGLEHVEGIVRIIYGLFVEGAMSLLSCGVAVLRVHSTTRLGHVADKHRLYTHDKSGSRKLPQ